MRLSVRLTIVFGLLGLIAISSVATLSWYLANAEIRAAVDDQLLQQASRFDDANRAELDDAVRQEFVPVRAAQRALFDNEDGGLRFYDQSARPVSGGDSLLSDDARNRLASGETNFLETIETEGGTYRVITVALDGTTLPADDATVTVVQIFAELSAEEAALSSLALRLMVVAGGGLALVASGSWFIGRWLARPLREVATAAERLAELDDLPGRIEVSRNDEIGRLADSFNRTLSALEVGREQQQRLVADASHELRTPLTSVRMRTEFLAANDDLPTETRQSMLSAAVADTEQLSALVSDLVDLAADIRNDDEPAARLSLAAIVDEVAIRTRTATGRQVDVDADDTEAAVRPAMVRRAVQNLVDNAVKYSPPDQPILVRVREGRFEVVDHGPGIAAEDADHVFDRFFRSPKARSRPGNGIGLAIVKQVAEAHDGCTWVTAEPDGGARVGFSVSR